MKGTVAMLYRFSRSCVPLAVLLWVASSCPVLFGALPESSLYLVGVGPGDADLITLRALEAIKKADLIFCTDGLEKKFSDYLSGKQVITGYWRLFEFYGQDINQLQGEQRARAEQLAKKRNEFIQLVRESVAQKKTVVILDSGDPLIYGPWAWCLEEFEDLKPVVVPGVSSFNAANAALRRGVTNASETKSVILTANDWPGKKDTIEKLSALQATMVIFTMRAEFDYFIKQLSTHYPPETPIAVVKYAGYADREEVVQSTLGRVHEEIDLTALPFEYLIYVGEFLTYRHKSLQAIASSAKE